MTVPDEDTGFEEVAGAPGVPSAAHAQLAVATAALRRLSLISTMAGTGQRDDDPEAIARCRYAAGTLKTMGRLAELSAAGSGPAGVPHAEHDSLYETVYWDICRYLDEALGTAEEDGAGGGLEADVRLLGAQRDRARADVAVLRQALLADAAGRDRTPLEQDRLASVLERLSAAAGES